MSSYFLRKKKFHEFRIQTLEEQKIRLEQEILRSKSWLRYINKNGVKI